tara:strand:- start:438 stop:1142 length:705 start_codon:yes stop_codon:yes gene_type:complete
MEKLIQLQGIDTKLKDLNDLLGDLPSKVELLNQQEESTKNSLSDNKKRLKEIEVEIHKRELEITQIDDKISKIKDQLFLVTNNKQYDALMTEMDHFKDKKSTFESETISFLEEKEELTDSIKTLETELDELSDDLEQRRKKLESAILESADEKLLLEKQRKERVDKLDVNIISVYDKVMGARDGLAVVPIVGSGCGGCGAHIPPQTITEVRAGTAMHRCDMCGRFLYNEEISVN